MHEETCCLDVGKWADIETPREKRMVLMRKKGVSRSKVLLELRKAWAKDLHFADGRILASMCTEPLAEAQEAHAMFFEANLGNPGLCPGTVNLEKQIIRNLANLLHGKGTTGHIVNGGNEANITALWIARNSRRGKKVILGKSAHFSFLKACDILGLKPVIVGLDRDYKIDKDAVRRKLDNDTCAVVGVAGTTELGVVDSIQDLSQICKGRAHLHIDAAFGGFVIPFLGKLGYDAPKFDFSLPGVSSITVDPHKMGLATIPAGCLLLRSGGGLGKIAVKTPYLTSDLQASLSGTRASGAVAGAYAAIRLLGRDGYTRIVKQCMENTGYLLMQAKEIGLQPALDPPPMNVLAFKVKRPEAICNELKKSGWLASTAQFPPSLRLVIMPHVTRKSIDDFMIVLKRSCKKLREI